MAIFSDFKSATLDKYGPVKKYGLANANQHIDIQATFIHGVLLRDAWESESITETTPIKAIGRLYWWIRVLKEGFNAKKLSNINGIQADNVTRDFRLKKGTNAIDNNIM